MTVPDASNENSCLLTFYQYGRQTKQEGDKTHLLNLVALQYLQEPTFDQLRTKEQLGYVVASRPRNTRDIIGCWFLIQSPTKDCLHIRKRLDIFLARMRVKVRNMTDEEFAKNVNSVKTKISVKDKNMYEEFARFWSKEF